MKKFVISLARTPERLSWWKENNNYIDDYEIFKAYDGSKISYPDLLNLGYDVNKSWRSLDSNHKHRLTDGEIGCMLSHYSLWKMCAEQDETFYISEDDIYTPETIYDIAKKYVGEYDFIYIGWTNRDRDIEPEYINGEICRPHLPWNMSSYFITPKAARFMVGNNIHKNLIVNDEYAPWILDQGQKAGKLNWGAISSNVNKEVVGLTCDSNVSFSGQNTLSSNAKIFNCYNTKVLTISTDDSKAKLLYESCAKNNIQITNIAQGIDWNGTDMSGPGGGQKINLFKKYFKENDVDGEDIILFVDGYDTFFSAGIDEIVERYFEMSIGGNEVIFGAEDNCWPRPEWADKFDLTKSYPFLNSGTFIGTARYLKSIFDVDIEDDGDDQEAIQKQYFTKKYPMILDHDQYIFMTMNEDLEIKNNDTYNSNVMTFGCLVHGQGDDRNKKKFAKLYDDLYVKGKHQPLITYLPNYNLYEQIEENMIVVDFLSERQCDKLIEISNNHGGWSPLDGDNFPAYEIRLKELSLLEDLESHMEDKIYPLVEKYWNPMAMYGVRDAFTMRYSVDTQKSLPLHNDASLVTGSIKLNDEYEGADLWFPRQKISNHDIPVGKMILFPGMVTHAHECTQLIDGVKYSLTIWTQRYNGDL